MAPLALVVNNEIPTKIPTFIKHKINQRKRLLKSKKILTTIYKVDTIKQLNNDIKNYFHDQKKARVRRNIYPGNTGSLWNAVKKAQDVNTNDLPNTMYINNTPIAEDELPDKIANYFNTKVTKLADEAVINENVYNGTPKIATQTKMFMDPNSIRECILSIKVKNCEGYDSIPQRCLIDGVESLGTAFNGLFKRFYEQSAIPEQWLVSTTIPVFKNGGDRKDIKNYRPISNLCSSSKIFEKLILKRILDLQADHNVDLTGTNQHRFEKHRSTNSRSLTIQTILANALEDDCHALMASIDLSAASTW